MRCAFAATSADQLGLMCAKFLKSLKRARVVGIVYIVRIISAVTYSNQTRGKLHHVRAKPVIRNTKTNENGSMQLMTM